MRVVLYKLNNRYCISLIIVQIRNVLPPWLLESCVLSTYHTVAYSRTLYVKCGRAWTASLNPHNFKLHFWTTCHRHRLRVSAAAAGAEGRPAVFAGGGRDAGRHPAAPRGDVAWWWPAPTPHRGAHPPAGPPRGRRRRHRPRGRRGTQAGEEGGAGASEDGVRPPPLPQPLQAGALPAGAVRTWRGEGGGGRRGRGGRRMAARHLPAQGRQQHGEVLPALLQDEQLDSEAGRGGLSWRRSVEAQN